MNCLYRLLKTLKIHRNSIKYKSLTVDIHSSELYVSESTQGFSVKYTTLTDIIHFSSELYVSCSTRPETKQGTG